MIDPHAYVTEQVAIILGRPVVLTEVQAARWWAMLSRAEERQAVRDAHGNFPHTASMLSRLGVLEHPPLHDDLAELERTFPPTPRWPEGRRFAACLTHDVDRIVACPWRERLRQVSALRDASPADRARWLASAARYRVQALPGASTAPYDVWLALEGQYGFHSTFFVLPERLSVSTRHDQYYRYDDLVRFGGDTVTFADATRRVYNLGCEIGLHGSYAAVHDAPALLAERRQVEDMLGRPVRSIRQHYLRFDSDLTPEKQTFAGVTADSTLGYSTTVGCRAGLAFPFFWHQATISWRRR